MIQSPQSMEIQIWHIDKFVLYARNPRRNDGAVDRMCASLQEFGFKIPVLARSIQTRAPRRRELRSRAALTFPTRLAE